MNQPPPLYRDQRMIDSDHLKLLSVLHFVGAGLGLLGLLFLFVHFTIIVLLRDSVRECYESKID